MVGQEQCFPVIPVFCGKEMEGEMEMITTAFKNFGVLGDVLVAESSPTFCDPMHCSPPGSSVHGISQATILEWVAIFFSRGSS